MNVLNIIIGTPLGLILWLCVKLLDNYGLAILLFTLLTKVILLPVSVWVHKNSIKMIQIQPEVNRLAAAHIYDKDKFYEEQAKVYKREKYNVFLSFIPLILQVFLVIGVINVNYNPLQHIFRLDSDTIETLTDKTRSILSDEEIGVSPQIKTIELINNPETAWYYSNIGVDDAVEKIKTLDIGFIGLNLSVTPDIFNFSIYWVIPLISALSSFFLCFVQNKINVLQKEHGFLGKWGMAAFLTLFSLYFGFAVATGVGVYWIFNNVLTIIQLFILNTIINPCKYIDYAALSESKKILAAAKASVPKKKFFIFDRSPEGKKEREDYKRFFSVPEDEMKLVFYSESSGFYKYFKTIIEKILENSDLKIHYVTSDANDAVFKMNEPKLVPYYIGESLLISLMMKITADMVVMTAPDLNRFHIKRSYVKKDAEYVFTDHGGMSVNMLYRAGALDYYDTFFAASQIQALEVRAIEKLRNTHRKNILKLGNPVLDSMITSYEASHKKANETTTILIAPSWQEDNILDSCLDMITNQILDKNWKIIVRPHPQYIRRFPERMQEIFRKYSSRFNDNFCIETDFSSNETVYSADLVITDWSSIGAEFSFTTLKPTLYINTKIKIVNPDYDKIDITPYIITVRGIIGKVIEKSETENIYSVIKELLQSTEQYKNQIKEERERVYYNLGKSGEVGAQYIIDRLCK